MCRIRNAQRPCTRSRYLTSGPRTGSACYRVTGRDYSDRQAAWFRSNLDRRIRDTNQRLRLEVIKQSVFEPVGWETHSWPSAPDPPRW